MSETKKPKTEAEILAEKMAAAAAILADLPEPEPEIKASSGRGRNDEGLKALIKRRCNENEEVLISAIAEISRRHFERNKIAGCGFGTQTKVGASRLQLWKSPFSGILQPHHKEWFLRECININNNASSLAQLAEAETRKTGIILNTKPSHFIANPDYQAGKKD